MQYIKVTNVYNNKPTGVVAINIDRIVGFGTGFLILTGSTEPFTIKESFQEIEQLIREVGSSVTHD